MPGAGWPELQYRRTPDRYDRRKSLWDDRRKSLWDEHRVRYCGGYSKRARPTAERLANEILRRGTFRQIQGAV